MEEQTKLSGRAYIAIGLMLFALFFGAGNLIFPASMGQQAGENVWPAVFGFVVTGVGIPFLGVLAIAYSGCRNAQELSGRVHPLYGIIYTSMLYLTIGPAFAIPRTGSVSYEIAVRPFLEGGGDQMTYIATMVAFFGISIWLSISPQKLVERIGKVLTPALLAFILVLVVKSLVTPLGGYGAPTEAYVGTNTAVLKGFLEGYNTLDALAGLVFAILVVDFVKLSGARSKEEITAATAKTGIVASLCLALVYIFIANLGATSVEVMGIFPNGAPVLAESAKLLFGQAGAVVLAVIVLLACLTTSIGLITSCAAYFNSSFGGLSYIAYVWLFSVVSFGVALFGLQTIISAAVPILMFLYPLTIVIIILAFSHNSFGGRQCVYAWTIGGTFISSLFSGLDTAGIQVFGPGGYAALPFHDSGMGWIPFAAVGLAAGLVHKVVVKK